MKGLAIKQNSVFVLAMVAQPFAMVGNENDQSPVIDVATLELFQEGAHDRIRGGYLAVVGQPIAAPVRFGRLVGGVRLVQVEKEKEGLLLDTRKPAEATANGFLPSALDSTRRLNVDRLLDRVIVEVEGVGKSGVGADNVGGDSRTCRIAPRPEQTRKRRMCFPIEAVANVVAHAMFRRQ